MKRVGKIHIGVAFGLVVLSSLIAQQSMSEQEFYGKVQEAETRYYQEVHMWEHYVREAKADAERNPTSARAQGRYLSAYSQYQNAVEKARNRYEDTLRALTAQLQRAAAPVEQSQPSGRATLARKAEIDAWFEAEARKLEAELNAAEARYMADPYSSSSSLELSQATSHYARAMEVLKLEYKRRLSGEN